MTRKENAPTTRKRHAATARKGRSTAVEPARAQSQSGGGGARTRRSPGREAARPKIKVPSPDSPWSMEVIAFALSYNGYDRHGGFEGAAVIASELVSSWIHTGNIRGDLSSLRCALFFEQRRAHHTNQPPDRAYLAALLAEIHRQSGGWVDGPADPYP